MPGKSESRIKKTWPKSSRPRASYNFQALPNKENGEWIWPGLNFLDVEKKGKCIQVQSAQPGLLIPFGVKNMLSTECCKIMKTESHKCKAYIFEDRKRDVYLNGDPKLLKNEKYLWPGVYAAQATSDSPELYNCSIVVLHKSEYKWPQYPGINDSECDWCVFLEVMVGITSSNSSNRSSPRFTASEEFTTLYVNYGYSPAICKKKFKYVCKTYTSINLVPSYKNHWFGVEDTYEEITTNERTGKKKTNIVQQGVYYQNQYDLMKTDVLIPTPSRHKRKKGTPYVPIAPDRTGKGKGEPAKEKRVKNNAFFN
jgi:hypothetical protein